MKKWLCIFIIPAFFLSSCSVWMQGNPAAVQAGAAVGGVVGSIIGDRAGGYTGSQFGALLGTVAGAAIGNAVTTPQNNNDPYGDEGYYVSDRRYYSSAPEYTSPIIISNIRFVDSSRDHVINADENAKIIFDITNGSDVALYNVTPIIEISGTKYIYVSPSREISYMEPGTTIRYTASLLSGKKLKTGEAGFNIFATDSNGGVSQYHRFSLPTQKRIR